ncbi:hypothetical protein BT96DRAFT_304177 [Gymnopus androsaceus JB14]|uniref:Uncharacterized protein n=1 Tax=Gymnopus androsaceus JB14 TaxID=1447944 RepID=A0A6A4GZW5_9AGAR|nr:hypothetical protein BT96DRAFT_304177 [Gymnopus androsaceus JB14]
MSRDTTTPTDKTYTIGESFYPIAPCEFERYERSDVVPDIQFPFDIQPGTVSFTHEPPKKGWVRYMHPEGAQYFCLQHALFMVYTDANLYTETILSKTDEFLQQVIEFISCHGDELQTVFDAETVDLVMDVTHSDQDLVCGYYFAHRPNQTIFWAHDFPASRRLWADVKGVRSELHILHTMQAQYWEHCALFPCSRRRHRKQLTKCEIFSFMEFLIL